MESNFFSGSENLYKYLVSIGLLMVVLTVYYPMRENQDLQILRIKLRSELKCISHEIDENQKSVDKITKKIKENNIQGEERSKLIESARDKTNLIVIKQISSGAKIEEIETREWFIVFYKIMVFIFLPIGVFLIIWGFIQWRKAKKNEDQKSELEKKLLEIQVQNATNQNNQTTQNP